MFTLVIISFLSSFYLEGRYLSTKGRGCSSPSQGRRTQRRGIPHRSSLLWSSALGPGIKSGMVPSPFLLLSPALICLPVFCPHMRGRASTITWCWITERHSAHNPVLCSPSTHCTSTHLLILVLQQHIIPLQNTGGPMECLPPLSVSPGS